MSIERATSTVSAIACRCKSGEPRAGSQPAFMNCSELASPSRKRGNRASIFIASAASEIGKTKGETRYRQQMSEAVPRMIANRPSRARGESTCTDRSSSDAATISPPTVITSQAAPEATRVDRARRRTRPIPRDSASGVGGGIKTPGEIITAARGDAKSIQLSTGRRTRPALPNDSRAESAPAC